MTGYLLRYRPGTDLALRFPTIRYPRHPSTRDRIEQMREAMPNPDAFEIIEADQ